MALCVLDCSAALSWVLPGEENAASDILLDAISRQGAAAPSLWAFETANVLLMSERRGRISFAEREQSLRMLSALPVAIDQRSATQTWTMISGLAARHRLTVYDASYLELAIRLGLPLATADTSLRIAATESGVALAA